MEYATLTEEFKTRFNVNASLLGVIDHFTKPKQIERLSGKVAQQQASLPVMKTIEAFRNGGSA